MDKIRINWHVAAICAIKITFREYSEYLQYFQEYRLAKSGYRIDLLMIRSAPDIKIPLSLAYIFRSHNLFEIKGIHSSITIHSYYKTIGYAALLIAEDPRIPPCTRDEISLSFLCHHKPVKLLRYLTEECKKNIAKSSKGIYHISGDIFPAQIIIVPELSPEEALYLRCLTDRLDDARLAEQLADDYSRHQGQQEYEEYMNQLVNANLSTKGDMLMCCEAIFRLYGTSSREFYDKGFQDCADKVRGIIAEKDAEIADKDAEIIRLKKLLLIPD
ncbi:MAG: hypothetical protein K2O97_03650 [Acetatifactor sp.]|nr:hypothetical protein [Acetatifactor sp.]